MKKIDYNHIASQSGREYKLRAINAEIAKVGIHNIAISDCLVNADRGGLLVMRTLLEHYKNAHDLTYKIRVLRDMWGNHVKPGQKIEWKFAFRHRDEFGRKMTKHQIDAYRRRGEIRQVEIWHHAFVDDAGCITVGFEDAAILLQHHGVHYDSKEPITHMPEKHREVTYDSYDRDLRKPLGVQHFWLYEEVPVTTIDETSPEPAQTRKKRSYDA